MNQLSLGIKESRKDAKKPYIFNNLEIYPLKVSDYEIFYACELALTVRLSSLPAMYASKSYASALLSMAMDESLVGTVNCEYWKQFITLVCMSLHINFDNASQQIKLVVGNEDTKELKALVITQYKSDEEVVQRLELADVGRLREIIALLNGCELPDESENYELIEADADIRSMGANLNLDINLDDIVAAVARDQRKRINELDDWTIWEFNQIRKAMERERMFTISGIGEMGGMVKWQNGNPYPSMFFSKKKENVGIVNAESFKQRISGAVEVQDSAPIGMQIPENN